MTRPSSGEADASGHLLAVLRRGLAVATKELPLTSAEGAHTFVVVLAADGVYRMLDTNYLLSYTGKSIDPEGGRFGPGNPRYLHLAYGYLPNGG